MEELGGLTMVEYRKWMVFERSHPFPAELADMHGAMISSLAVNLVRSPGSAPVDWRDFLFIKRVAPEVVEEEGTSEAAKFASVLGR